MTGDITEKVLDEMSTRRLEQQALISARESEMRGSCAALKAIDMRIARACLAERASLPAMLAERDKLVKEWLAVNKKPLDWLFPVFQCSACKDTGHVAGKLCACVRNEVARQMFSDAGLTANSPSFDRFDLTLFPDNTKIADGRTVREHMTFLRDLGLSYASRFPELQKPNMLFYGMPGRGKTYLMDCIAGQVISRGFWAVRATAFGVNDVMAKALFDRADPDSLFECDLLVLDDLGSEPLLNKVTISSLFNLLNERLARRKPFIISTNLTPEEILKRYGDRVFSRMTDVRTTRLQEFEGVDLRKNY